MPPMPNAIGKVRAELVRFEEQVSELAQRSAKGISQGIAR
jgi:hypothetical protein